MATKLNLFLNIILILFYHPSRIQTATPFHPCNSVHTLSLNHSTCNLALFLLCLEECFYQISLGGFWLYKMEIMFWLNSISQTEWKGCTWEYDQTFEVQKHSNSTKYKCKPDLTQTTNIFIWPLESKIMKWCYTFQILLHCMNDCFIKESLSLQCLLSVQIQTCSYPTRLRNIFKTFPEP